MIYVSLYPIEIIEITRNHKYTDKFNITNKTKIWFRSHNTVNNQEIDIYLRTLKDSDHV